MSARRRLAAAVLVSTLGSVATPAQADPSGFDRALATELFLEARELMLTKDYDNACPKLVESHRLDPGGGTILNAAICHELAGKTATAWTELNEALAWALRDKRSDRDQTAREHIATLEPRLSRITVVVPDEVARLPDLVVAQDGRPLARAAWGSAIPVDPGAHRVEASASRRVTWSTTIEVAAEADRKTVTVPILAHVVELAPLVVAPVPDPPVKDRPSSGSSTRRLVGLGVLGAGVVTLGVGGFFGVRAITKQSESDDACAPICRADAVTLNDEARTAADVATVTIGAALLLLGVGGWLFATSPSPSPHARTPLRYTF